MKFHISFLLIISTSILLVSSCKKDNSTPQKSVREMITSHSWIHTSSLSSGVEQLSDCEKDNVVTFSSNGIYLVTPGVIKCSTNDQNLVGTWILSSDNKTISGVEENEPYSSTISEISENKLVLTMLMGTETFIDTLIYN